MRLMFAVLSGLIVLSGVAHAQTSSDTVAYVEGIAQSAFGNVTSQSFGAEAGYRIAPRVHVFVELGRARDTAPKGIGAAAQIVAGYLTRIQSSPVTYSVRQPFDFGIAGIRYSVPYNSRIEPYILGGAGLARITRDVGFSVGGTDVTSTIANYGVALGSDLSGTIDKLMLSAGAGVVWRFDAPFFFDAGYRYGYAFTDGEATTVNRVGLGVGLRF